MLGGKGRSYIFRILRGFFGSIVSHHLINPFAVADQRPVRYLLQWPTGFRIGYYPAFIKLSLQSRVLISYMRYLFRATPCAFSLRFILRSSLYPSGSGEGAYLRRPMTCSERYRHVRSGEN
jgi:hypothetical protein